MAEPSIDLDLLDSRSRHHWSHDHPLVFTNNGSHDQQVEHCSICEQPITHASNYYSCIQSHCKFHLHQICANLSLNIHHPFFHSHTLELQKKPPHIVTFCFSDICYDECEFFYYCSACDFALDVKYALLPQLIAGDFSKLDHVSHHHPLILATKMKRSVRYYPCAGCEEATPGLVYSCEDCEFYIHKRCAELPLQITHRSHRRHPLVLLTNAPPNQGMCSCYLCRNGVNGFVYHCSLCDFGLKVKHVLSSQIEIGSHEHPFNLISKPMSFICDACGTSGGDCIPYVCNECDLAVHKDCIWLPKTIKISRHPHPISHVYFLLENEGENRWECRICYTQVNTECGCYYCSDCKYIVHVNCAVHRDWFEVEVRDQQHNETLRLLLDNSITSAEDVTATEIKHVYHQHNLKLSEEDMITSTTDTDTFCDACMRAISGPFYFCEQCDFFVHKSCAKLPITSPFWLYRFLFALWTYDIDRCRLCGFYSSGFNYYFKDICICLRCFAPPDTLEHQGHEHRLFFDISYKGDCSGCGKLIDGGYICKDCSFALDFSTCISLPHTIRHKYDEHPLALAYHDSDDDDPGQYYCDICEEERNSCYWFYHCSRCNFTAHIKCTLGEYPFIKRGIKFRFKHHSHRLVSVQKGLLLPLVPRVQ